MYPTVIVSLFAGVVVLTTPGSRASLKTFKTRETVFVSRDSLSLLTGTMTPPSSIKLVRDSYRLE